MSLGTVWLGVAGCLHVIPDHLRLDGPTSTPVVSTPTTGPEALAQLLAGDPLWRDVRTEPDDTVLSTLGLGALARMRRVLLDAAIPDLARVEGLAATDGTGLGATWLAGLHVAAADVWLGSAPSDAAPGWTRALQGLAPLADEPEGRAGGVSAAAWLGEGTERVAALRSSLERRVWVGWLSVPRGWLPPVVEAADRGWAASGSSGLWSALVRAKSEGREDDVARVQAREALATATGWALEEVVADDAAQRSAWRARIFAATGAEDPMVALTDALRDVVRAASLDGGRDESIARALVAGVALRTLGACDDPPCAGLDRAATWAAAERLHPAVTTEARVWSAIALRAAIDRLEVGHDTVAFPRAAVDLTDALVGRGLTPRDVAPLTRRRPDLWVWSAWGEGLGAPRAASWDDVRALLVVRLEQEANGLQAAADIPAAWSPWLARLVKPPRRPTEAREL